MLAATKAQGACQLGMQCANTESSGSLMVYAPLYQLLRRGEKCLKCQL